MSTSYSIPSRLLILAGGLLVIVSVGAAISASLDWGAATELAMVRGLIAEGHLAEAEHLLTSLEPFSDSDQPTAEELRRKLDRLREVEKFDLAQAAILERARAAADEGRMERAGRILAEAGEPDPKLAAQVGGALLEEANRQRRGWDEEEARRLLELAKRVFGEKDEIRVIEAELLIAETERIVRQSEQLLETAGNAIAEGDLEAAEVALIAFEAEEFSPAARARAAELNKVIVSEREDRDREAVQKRLTRLLDEGKVREARQLMERHSRLTGNTEYGARITVLTELEKAGGAESYLPVRNALRFLVKCQAKHGGFSGEQYRLVFPKDKAGGKWSASYNLGITGLCLMAFTAFRDLDVTGEFDKPAKNCAKYLTRSVSRSGNISGTHYNHAIVALALLERVLALGKPATRAEFAAAKRIIVYLTRTAQLPDGGWRYATRGTSDSSVTCWVLQALHAARQAGIEIHEKVPRTGMAYLSGITNAEGWTGYTSPGGNVTMTAATLLARQLFPEFTTEGSTERARDLLLGYLQVPLKLGREPTTSGTAVTRLKELWLNHYGWYYATYAFHLEGGDAWTAWGPLLANTLKIDQEKLGELAGSWAPDPRWGKRAGRLYTTALNALTLEVYYR